MESQNDELEEGPLSDLSELAIDNKEKEDAKVISKTQENILKMSDAENIDKTSKQITEGDNHNFDIGYMNRNVVLDPEHQQTRFYNLQAESTLSSLDSNLDPYIPKDPYLPPVSPNSPKQLISNRDANVAKNVFVLTSHTDGVEGDDEYEEEIEIQSVKQVTHGQKERNIKETEGLQINLDLSEGPMNQTQENLNEIIFSPGGNEAYVFAPVNVSDSPQMQHKSPLQSDSAKDIQLDSQNTDFRFIGDIKEPSTERTKNVLPMHPRGERPTTVGQSDDSPKKNTQTLQNVIPVQKNFGPPSRSPRLSSSLLKHKQSLLLAQVSTTDDTDYLYSTEHSADPSPRRLPELPNTREHLPYLNRDMAVPYQDVLPSPREKDDDELTGHISGGQQFDRTTSPSMASVTSGYSVTSSLGGGTGSLRKNLEWDTTADLRTDKHWTENDVEIQNQREAARKIIIENDNLSQMVIETYSNYFPREDPEGKPSKRNTVTSGGAIQTSSTKQGRHNNRPKWGLPMRPDLDLESKERNQITNNWIQSITQQHARQGNLKGNSDNSTTRKYIQNKSNSSRSHQIMERRRRRSRSAEKYDETKFRESFEANIVGGSTSAASTPEKTKKKILERKLKQRLKYGSPLKSASLSELDLNPNSVQHKYANDADRRGSSSSLMTNWLTKHQVSHISHSDQYGPSSISSTGTVIQLLKESNYSKNNALLEQIASGSSSLPPELQHILIQATHSFVNSKQNVSAVVSQESPDDSRMSREQSKTSQTSLSSSRQSGSRSCETVIDISAATNHSRHMVPIAPTNISQAKGSHKIARKSINQRQMEYSDTLDTEEEIQLVKRSSYTVRRDAEGKESGGSSGPSNSPTAPAKNNDMDEDNRRAQSLPNENWKVKSVRSNYTASASTQNTQRHGFHKQNRKHSPMRKTRGITVNLPHSELPMFQPSSAATTSDDERLIGVVTRARNECQSTRRDHMVEGAGGGRVRRTSYPANSSTLESGAPIDRAKSFEYFPGESFPLQENSSSYEYLPGHMISDRPGTVVSNHPRDERRAKEGEENIDGASIPNSPNIDTPPSQVTNGEYSTTTSIQSSSNGDTNGHQRLDNNKKIITSHAPKGHYKKRKQYNLAYEIGTQTNSPNNDLDILSNEMMHKYKHLQNAQLSQTRNFYQKMRRYIEFISTPSNTPSDCILKQRIADRLLQVMTDEEQQLSRVKSLSCQFGNLFVTETSQKEKDNQVGASMTPSPDPTALKDTKVSNLTETDENEIVYSNSVESPSQQITVPTMQDKVNHRKNTDKKESNQTQSIEEEIRVTNDPSLPRASPHYFPTLQNWIGPSKIDHKSPNSNDVEIQKLRIEQMKKLRKEIRKLEKLECIRLNKALGVHEEENNELMRQFQDTQSSFDSLLSDNPGTSITESTQRITDNLNVPSHHKQDRPTFANESNRRGIEGKSASGSDINSKIDNKRVKMHGKSFKMVREPIKKPKKVNVPARKKSNETNMILESRTSRSTAFSKDETRETLSSIQVHSGIVIGKGTNTYTKSTKLNKEGTKTNIVHTAQQSQKTEKPFQDFSQNFPTPRNADESISAEHKSNGNNIDSSSVTSVSETSTSIVSSQQVVNNIDENISRTLTPQSDKRKSFAYYLPLHKESAIRIGARVLRERRLEGSLNKENRNILSNYISAINASAEQYPKKKTRKMRHEASESNSLIETPKTLKDALFENKPDFIKKSESRVEILRQIKEERCLYSEMRRNLLENIAKDAPKNQVRNLPLSTIPKPKPRRLFDYKEMVKETRLKYENLPEVLNAKYKERRTSIYRTNRLMADIYQRKLKGHVLKGKISMNHNFNIIT